MKRKITCYFLILIFGTAIAVGGACCMITDRYYKNQIREEMLLELSVIEQDSLLLEEDYDGLARKYVPILNIRMTVVGQDGSVLFDTLQEVGGNHADRPEIADAFLKGSGFSERKSENEDARQYYAAADIGGGRVLRISKPQQNTDRALRNILLAVSGCCLVCIGGAVLLSLRFSKKIVEPLQKLKLHVEKNIAAPRMTIIDSAGLHDEVLELAVAYNNLADKVNGQMDEIEKLQSVRSEFVANVSHELKTPLTSIRGFVETLRGGALEKREVADRFLKIIDIEAVRLQNLINDILVLSKIEKMEEDLNVAEFSLNTLAREVLEMLTPLAREKEIRMELCAPAEIKMTADEAKIRQLLMNLVSNAVRYNREAGSVTISLTCLPDGEIRIAVEDTGIGMTQEDCERIFERFYCVDKGRSQKNGGTGLGLSIVKHIANLYHGDVRVDSVPGKGSTFTVTLRAEADDDSFQKCQRGRSQ